MAVLLAGLLGTAFAAAADVPRERQVTAPAPGFAEPLALEVFRPAERAFLLRAAESSRQQMRLAQVGLGRATNADVRSHAQQLMADYKLLGTAVDALIRRKGGGVAGAPAGETSEDYRKLLESTGGDFDREFLRTVAQTTSDVLTLFEQVASESKDKDVRELAAAELPTLRAHRSEVTELLKALY